jgi:murein DD-endopeptidase MepM/ murein hydrolase activator NlpD
MRRHRHHLARSIRPFLICLLLLGVMGVSAPAAGASGTWLWPVSGPVIRGFDPPDSPYGSGHRGIDIAAPVGTQVKAVDTGTVTFAGTVGGQTFLTIAHGGGLSSTYSWLSGLLVHEGALVARGQPVALSGWGHPGGFTPCLHLGAKLGSSYVDPLTYLRSADVADLIRLAPM